VAPKKSLKESFSTSVFVCVESNGFVSSGKRKGEALESNALETNLKGLFSLFNDKGIQYDWKKDFNRKVGEFAGIMNHYWEQIRKKDPKFGTKRNQEEQRQI
jgi:hypothetical protein